jgi:hypothetical protein
VDAWRGDGAHAEDVGGAVLGLTGGHWEVGLLRRTSGVRCRGGYWPSRGVG